MTSTLLIAGHAVTTSRVNLRQAQPTRTASVLRKVEPGVNLTITALAVGDEVEGNAFWYRTDENAYVWAGGCGPFQPGPAGLAPAPAAGLAPHPAIAPVAIPPVAAGVVLNVLDLSHGTKVTSFANARAAGLIGVIHKASTGMSGHDELYAERRTAAREAGLLWGAYHWGTARPVADQVENFLTAADPDDETLVALDYERDVGNQMSLEQAREFLERIQDRLGRKAVLYSGSTIKEQLGNRVDPFFGSHRLWLPQYGPAPHVQASWSTFWLWQYSDGTATSAGPVRIAGIPGDGQGRVDCDYYPGGEARLRAEWAS
jgi:lysozyme